MYKYKSHINKNNFYIILTQVALLTVALLVWLLIPFGMGIKTSEYEKITHGLSEEEVAQLGQQVATKTLISYLSNTLVIVFYMFYAVLLRHKLKYGYIFLISWIIVFSAIAFMPFYQGTKLLSSIQIVFGSIISAITITIILNLLWMTVQFHIQRKFHNYELYKIYKGRSK